MLSNFNTYFDQYVSNKPINNVYRLINGRQIVTFKQKRNCNGISRNLFNLLTKKHTKTTNDCKTNVKKSKQCRQIGNSPPSPPTKRDNE